MRSPCSSSFAREAVSLEQVPIVLDHGSHRPATGVMAFAWGGLRKEPDKVEAIGRFYRAISPARVTEH
jgi:hypothetical protein